MRSPSLNIRREKNCNYVIGDRETGAEHTTISDEELLLDIEHEFELNDGKFQTEICQLKIDKLSERLNS